MTVFADFEDAKPVHRLLHLVHRDLARVRGNIVMAKETLQEEEDAGRPILPGRVRSQLRKTLETGSEQQRVLEQAQDALKEGLAAARERGDAEG